MTLACQFQHILAQPIPILPASGIDRTQLPANVAAIAEAGVTGTYRERTDSPLAGLIRGTTPEVPPLLPEPYHIEDACKWLNRMTDGEARDSNPTGWGQNLATGNSFCAGGGEESAERGANVNGLAGVLPFQAPGDAPENSAPPARTSLCWASVQLPEFDYLETICDAIECADEPDDFRIIRAAIARVGGAVNRQSLRMMVELREQEVCA